MATNPFPGYPVSQLDEARIERRATLETGAIRQARELIARWESLRETAEAKPLTVAVRGDWGSGKTHLLLDAIERLQANPERQANLLRVVGVEADPLAWYCTTIGPRVAALPLESLVVKVYALAAKDVARAAKLTEGAVERLQSEPESVRKLVRDDLLSRTEVDQEFEAKLRSLAGEISFDAVRAFASLVWFETAEPARRWLAGEELSGDDADSLGLPRSLTSEEQVSDLLVFLGALHAATGQTLSIFVDELEHFARHQADSGARSNMTWFKRLLQGLAAHDGITFVAGHWSAWDVEPDVLQRFDSPPVDLLRLMGPDVLMLARSREPKASGLDADQGVLIADLCDGNIRRTVSLLRELWALSSGFTESLSADDIKEAAVVTGQRISPEIALLRVHEALEQLGLAVTREQVVPPGIEFDLVATRAGQPVALVSAKAASHEIEGFDELARFVDQLREVGGDAVGCFLSRGSIGEELRERVGTESQGRVLVLDATDPDIATNVGAALLPLLSESDGQTPLTGADEEIARLDRERERLAEEVAALRESQQRDIEEILERVRRQQRDAPDRRDAALLEVEQSDSYRAPLAVRYEELLARPNLKTMLSYALDMQSVALLAIAALALAAVVIAASAPSSFGSVEPEVWASIVAVGAIVLFVATAMFVRRLVQVSRFFDYRDHQLRRAYLHSEDESELLAIYERLQDSLDRGGPNWRWVLDSEEAQRDASFS